MAMPIKCYNIAEVGENDAELTMYGEVVDTRPIDWWTGQPVPGNYIALDEILPELDTLANKNNITVHINSVGGDFYAGLAIYNRLKNLKANIITINDSLAASAGSIILQAGDTRKVRAASNTMVHGVLGFMYGYYNTQDLKKVIKQFEAGNKAAINAYAEAGGQDPEKIKSYMDKETWLTGQEAVDAGFADEVIEPEAKLSMSMAQNRSFMEVNGLRLSAQWMPHTLPSGVNIVEENNVSIPAAEPTGGNNNNGGNDPMSNTINTVEELRAAYPDLVAQLETAARNEAMAQGASNERARLQAIEDIRNGIGNTELVRNAMFGDEPMTAEQLAFQAIKANAVQGNAILNSLGTETQPAQQVAPAAAPATEPAANPNAAPEDDLKAIMNVIKK
jgi:ATP-dependent Clp endopeptidase proteolytic subunit ClpP